MYSTLVGRPTSLHAFTQALASPGKAVPLLAHAGLQGHDRRISGSRYTGGGVAITWRSILHLAHEMRLYPMPLLGT